MRLKLYSTMGQKLFPNTFTPKKSQFLENLWNICSGETGMFWECQWSFFKSRKVHKKLCKNVFRYKSISAIVFATNDIQTGWAKIKPAHFKMPPFRNFEYLLFKVSSSHSLLFIDPGSFGVKFKVIGQKYLEICRF